MYLTSWTRTHRLKLCVTIMKLLTKLVLPGALLLLCAFAPTLAQPTGDAVKEAQRLTRVAQVAEQQGRYDDAIKAYQTIAVVAKNSPRIAAAALLNAGNIYMSVGKFDAAARCFHDSLALDSNSAAAQNNLGEALGELKQYQRALEAFQHAVALDGAFVKARYNMGVTYDRLGQLKYAEFVYRILIRDHPDFALAYDSMAVTLSKSGRGREAIPLHQKAISLNPKDPSFYYNFAVSYMVLGEVKKAQEQQQKLRALDPAMAEHLGAVIARHQ
ncbi:MAG: protein O-mannosyl-transferase [Blastocatellia bacterium]|nr:protein O-mannosyl-transferase [Blastocatellia bacterium]